MEMTQASTFGAFEQVRSIWQQRSASGATIWTSIVWAFTFYWGLFVSGVLFDHKVLNAVGGVIVLAILAWILLDRLWVHLDAVVLASVAAAVGVPLLQLLAGHPPTNGALFKHVSLCLVIAVAQTLRLPAAFQSKSRFALAAQVLAILLISLTIHKGTSWDGGTRHSGLFVNPNNLALIPFLLLFFINPVKDHWLVRLAVHGIVATVLLFTGTSGAVLAYVIGLLIHLSSSVPQRARSIVYGILIAAGLGGVIFIAAGGERLLPETRLTNQISVIRGQLTNVLDGSDVAYYAQERVLGPGSASGIWRVAHWRKTVVTYAEGTLAQQLFGFGIGSSPGILGKLPHNEYLRMLFEQGLVGFVLFLFIWQRLIRRAPAAIRYIGVIVAIYSFSENNLDNFPFMALLILCLSAREVTAAIPEPVKAVLPALWRRRPQFA